MNKSIRKSLLIITGAILFNLLFWQEKLAVNMLLFDGFVLGSVFYLYPLAWAKPGVKGLCLAHLLTLGALVFQNTLLSKLACSITLLLLVSFVQYLHRSVWYAAGSAFMNMVMMVPSFAESLSPLKRHGLPATGLRKGLRFLVIPLVITAAFLGIYALANAVFREVLTDVGVAVQHWITHLFTWFSWARFGFLLLGLFVCGVLLLKASVVFFSEKDMRQVNDLYRRRGNFKAWKKSGWFDLLSLFMGRFANGTMALRNENTVGITSLFLLNLLLFSINSIDVVYVWFGFRYNDSLNLSAYVHEGTGLLILSIVLAMAVLLFFFRGNLNFYTRNKWLRYGAIAWIVQNMILVVSVFIRDYYYFVHMGLAYKRIGVVVFLVMVLAGLVTVFLKIQWKKSNYFLFRVNAWVAVVVLTLCSLVHWDLLIAEHNLARKGKVPVDVNFLLSLSDRTLPVIEQNKEVLDTAFLRQMDEVNYIYRDRVTPMAYFTIRKQSFFAEQDRYSWLSWNLADATVKQELPRPLISLVKQ